MTRLSTRSDCRTNATARPDSLLGSIALIAGTTIGAGILALPAVTQSAGVIPATLALIGTWLYMLASGLLIVEANANLGLSSISCTMTERSPSRGIFAMARQTLGSSGAIATGLAYSFLHYALLVAYLARGGEILYTAALDLGLVLPAWSGPCAVAALLGGLLFWGSQRFVSRVNSLLLLGAISAFLALIAFCLPQVVPSRLLVARWGAIARPIPTLLVALVFHNTLPTVSAQLDGNIPRIRRAMTIGSMIPLVMFVVWNAVILGSTNANAVAGYDPLTLLVVADSSPLLPASILLFSGLAIATSFIGFVYGLLEFYSDLWPSGGKRAFALTLVPPLLLALTIPGAFFAALDYAGIFGITILFGILPAAMVWRQRHLRATLDGATEATDTTGTSTPLSSGEGLGERIGAPLATRDPDAATAAGVTCPPLLPGGYWSLIGTIAIAIAIVLQQLAARLAT